jgi:FKBP-type peptidyl-prolyl cis-trans isomerase SlyD
LNDAIQAGSRVEFHYELLDEAGRAVESTREEGPVAYTHGLDEILPGLEAALTGHRAGDVVEVRLGPDAAYGTWDPEGVVHVPRGELPQLPAGSELCVGDWITVQLAEEEPARPHEHGPGCSHGEDEHELEMRVVELGADEVVLDANHPLSSQTVTFQVTVIAVA